MTKLAVGLSVRDWRVQVISMLPIGDSRLASEMGSAGIRVRSLEMKPHAPSPLAILSLARMVREFSTDVLHSHMVKANILARLAAPLAGAPVQISTAHNTIEGGRWVQWAYRATDRLADLTTNVSQRAVDRYVRIGAVPAGRIRLVRNGLDLSPFDRGGKSREELRDTLGIGSDFTWLAVGRLSPQKDYANMLEAFQQVLERHGDTARLVIVGRGPLSEQLMDIATTLGVKDSVHLLGERGDVPDLMRAVDAYVLSSAWEGAPIVLLEAAASRLQAVATDVGGNAELVVDGETGLLVPARNSVALGEAMLRIMALPEEQRAAMGAAARHRTENEFAIGAILDEWEGIYTELIDRKNAAG
jgi:glycosyltransferase involved in cell wall biosynthesis